jgi:hypothetical protein
MGFAVRLQWDLNARGVTYNCLGYSAAGLDGLIRPRFQGILVKYQVK